MKNRKIISNNIFMLRYIFLNQPVALIGSVITNILISMIGVFCNIVLLRFIINTVLAKKNIDVIFEVTIYLAIYIIFAVSTSTFFNEYCLPVQKEKLFGKIQKDLNKKAISMDLSCYDDPNYYNELIWNMTSMEQNINSLLDNISRFSGYLAGFCTTIAVFAMIDKVLLVLVGITIFLTLIFNKPIASADYEKVNENRIYERKRMYIQRVFRQGEYAKEIRLSKISHVLKNEYEKNQKEYENSLKKHNKKIWILNFLQIYLSGYFMVNFVIVLYLGYQILVTKKVMGGDFVAIYNGINTLLGAMYYLIGNFLQRMIESGYFIDKFRTFLENEPSIKSGKRIPSDSTHTLEFKNVCFSYPNGKEILKNINCKIVDGQKIAIVGINGAGKSTFIKLMLRLYDVLDGEILLDGINIKEYDIDHYRQLFGVAFQDFQVYATSLKNNITGGIHYDSERLLKVINQCDLSKKVNSLEHGVDTELLKEFNEDGILLSGGETQKVALARALYQDSNYVILDEPSAALDPIAEQQINKTIINVSSNRTVIFISHRLTTTVDADCIYVISDGKIIEHGSHQELLKQNQTYAKMWHYQANKYL